MVAIAARAARARPADNLRKLRAGCFTGCAAVTSTVSPPEQSGLLFNIVLPPYSQDSHIATKVQRGFIVRLVMTLQLRCFVTPANPYHFRYLNLMPLFSI
ncbi:hypothetical protein AB3X91_38400 [Paraburkholderia sp. BR14263]|uniref:Uncharacterized protein n=1 Tax=Paraburkholderia ferrariae TaxID=386056 RepID=A0ABU9RRY6_9BURK